MLLSVDEGRRTWGGYDDGGGGGGSGGWLHGVVDDRC